MSKTAVILLGAGAPLAWKGPTTWQITESLFESKDYLTTDGVNLAFYIQECLAKYNGCEPSKIHFEYIINALETLSDYLHEESGKGNPPQFVGSRPLWFSLSEVYKKMENFKFIPTAGTSQGHLINLTGGSGVLTSDKTYKYAYFNHAIDHYLMKIRNAITRYDYKDALAEFKEENEGLVGFYQALKERGYVVRFYTTNYDDMVPNILELTGADSPYRGFCERIDGNQIPDINKILTSSELDCYYNLHGSIYWQSGTNEFYEPGFWYMPGIPSSAPIAHVEITNPSETTTIYNIITGFNKLQKVSVEPLKAYFTALANDSIKADLIATIGYSYGDSHVNRSLGYGVKYGKAKFLHVTKSENFFGSTEFIYMQEHTMKRQHHENSDHDRNWIWTRDKKAAVYRDGFSNFLAKKEWPEVFRWL